jgi:hypothetical protein
MVACDTPSARLNPSSSSRVFIDVPLRVHPCRATEGNASNCSLFDTPGAHVCAGSVASDNRGSMEKPDRQCDHRDRALRRRALREGRLGFCAWEAGGFEEHVQGYRDHCAQWPEGGRRSMDWHLVHSRRRHPCRCNIAAARRSPPEAHQLRSGWLVLPDAGLDPLRGAASFIQLSDSGSCGRKLTAPFPPQIASNTKE